MISGKTQFDVPSDGMEVRFDLLQGVVVKEGGDLVFRLSKQVSKEHRDLGQLAPHLEISAMDGGFQKSNASVPHDAPKIESRESLNFGNGVSNHPGWLFYSFTRGKLYSHFNIHYNYDHDSSGRKDSGKGSIRLEWLTNPSGSRNLEYDRAKDVTKEYAEKK